MKWGSERKSLKSEWKAEWNGLCYVFKLEKATKDFE